METILEGVIINKSRDESLKDASENSGNLLARAAQPSREIRSMATTVVWPVARAQGKENRREAILTAAEELVRETRSTEFSVGILAVRANVSVATLYNLLGTKGAILYALLNRTMDQFEAATSTFESNDPYEEALAAATAVARVYVQDSEYLRPLWRFELGVIEPEHRPALMNRALGFWASRLGALERSERLPKGVGLVDLAREYQIFFAGVLDLWVQNELTDQQLEVQVRYGILMRLLALGDPAEQARLMADLRETHQLLHSMNSTEAA